MTSRSLCASRAVCGLTTAVLFTCCLLSFPAAALIDWAPVPHLTEADRKAITEIVERLHFDADTIEERHRLPAESKFYVIRSPVFVTGRRISWREFSICPNSDSDCANSTHWGVGNWRVRAEPTLQERWRFMDGDWSIDVKLGGAVSYAEAETIIHAIQRQQLRSALSDGAARTSYDADDIRVIETFDPLGRRFSVTLNSGSEGYLLEVQLNGDEVQLLIEVMYGADVGGESHSPVIAALGSDLRADAEDRRHYQ